MGVLEQTAATVLIWATATAVLGWQRGRALIFPIGHLMFAPWELRIGRLRVYFDVQEEPERVVKIRAVGLKDRNRAVTPIKRDDWESIAVANNPKFLAIIERSRKSTKPGLSTGEMRRRLGLRRRTG